MNELCDSPHQSPGLKKGDLLMFSKKSIMLMAFQFPVTLLVGVLLTFAYSMQIHEHPGVNWPIAIALAIVFDVVATWLQNRHDKERMN